MYTVYKHLNENEEIIYIGKSKSLLYNQRQHNKNAEWFCEVDSIEYCPFSSKSGVEI
jgi:excinuclease UvrABC nuclease subunit